ncbi:MAG: copper resistance protein B [Steroidobacteraceae bacterium]
MSCLTSCRLPIAASVLLSILPHATQAQQQPAEPGWPQPVENDRSFGYALLNQNELRVGSSTSYRWDGEGWYGGDLDRLWVKSEGSVDTSDGTRGEAEVQGLYSRAVSPFFNVQGGMRYDFDPASRGWAALGVEGFAPLNWEIGAFAFLSSGGHLGARFEGDYDLYLTQRLVLQPQFELNAYSRPDRAARIGTGLTDGDFGLRLRYELRREFAPYIGLTYEARYGATADLARAAGFSVSEVRFVAGIRASL